MSAVPDLVTAVLLTALLLVLAEILRAVSAGTLLPPQQARRRIEFDWALLAAASAFIILPLLLGLLLSGGESAGEKSQPQPVRTEPHVHIDAAILSNFVVIAVLIALIVARRKNWLTDYGIDLQGWLAEMRFGGLGFLASLPFVIAIILLTTRWRSPDTQNPLLILLHQTGSQWTILQVAFTAVVSAPLAEELLFRVALQGSLETRLPPAWAIALPAIIFASVHGPYDALPLLPLALVLGGLYHLRRSYVAVVTAHALFNAAFLILAIGQRGAA